MAQQEDACTLLDDDHNAVMRLFEQYKSAHDLPRKQELAQRICHDLMVHMQIEEEIFYPAFLQATSDNYRVQDSKREHQGARDLMGRLQSAHPDDRLMLELEDAIIHHINDERDKMFPEARKSKNMNLMELGRRLEARKMELMAGHPA